jgi:hypothetical protein
MPRAFGNLLPRDFSPANDGRMGQKEFCIQELDKLMTDLRAQGMDTSFILAALTEIMMKAATSEPEKAAGYLENVMAILDANTQSLRAANVMQQFWNSFGQSG